MSYPYNSCSHFGSSSHLDSFEMAHSHLAKLLVQLFAKGELAGTTLLSIATAAYLDGWGQSCPLARKLVKAGSGGRNRGKIADGVIKAAESEGLVSSACKPYVLKLSTGFDCEMFLPHEWYPEMVADDIRKWCLQAGNASQASLYRLLEQWASHEDVQCTDDLSHVGVLGFHCDAAQYTSSNRAGGARSLVVGSMNIISSSSVHLRSRRQPVFVLQKGRLCKCGCQGYHTLQDIFGLVDVLSIARPNTFCSTR